MAEWTSIEEGLPRHHAFCWLVTGGRVDRGTFYAYGDVWMDDDSGPFEAVTHWQEIIEPKPPAAIDKVIG